MQNTTNLQSSAFGHGGWKYYNTIKKKAMEQEFSWSGLFISLSIAFFVFLVSAQLLNFAYESMIERKNQGENFEQKVYYLESAEHINIKVIKDRNERYPDLYKTLT